MFFLQNSEFFLQAIYSFKFLDFIKTVKDMNLCFNEPKLRDQFKKANKSNTGFLTAEEFLNLFDKLEYE